MNQRQKKRLEERKRRLRRVLVAEVIVAVLAVLAAAAFALIPDRLGNRKLLPWNRAEETTLTAETEVTLPSETETTAETTAAPDLTEEPETTEETETETTPEETETESETETTTEEHVPDYGKVVLVGDSRTLTLGTGGALSFQLVPDDSICATWGGQLTDESAFENATNAARKHREKTAFWYGINDVQLNPQRNDPWVFVQNYDRLLQAFRTEDDESTIYLLSILPTTVREKDYYEGQDQNIAAYNQALKEYAQNNGFIFLDLSPLYTGDDCFYEGDNIHFSQAWYEERFLPALSEAMGY